MQRVCSILLAAFLLVGLTAAPQALAQEDDRQAVEEDGAEVEVAEDDAEEPVEEVSDDGEEAASTAWTADDVNAKRDPGYLNLLKFIPVVLLVILWTVTGDWVNRSSQLHGLGYGKWNPIVFFPFLIAFAVFVLVPNYIVGISLLSLAYIGPFIAYTVAHNKSVEDHEKVFTKDWFRYTVAEMGNKFGLKMSHERKADYEKGAPVELDAVGGGETAEKANLITARQSPGYLLVKELVAEMADKRSERMVLDYTAEGVAVKHLIDGVWHNGEARDRESGDVMLAVMKQLANMDITERRQKQEGRFAAKYDGIQYLCPFTTQGVKTGERVLMEMTGGAQARLLTYEDLGMREKIRAQWAELMAADEGFLVIAAPPEGGLSTLTDVSILETDRLMRDFVSIEDLHDQGREFENVAVHTYDSKQGETVESTLPGLIRTYPNVYILRDIREPEAAKLLMNEVDDNHLLITTVPAMEAPEALLRMLQKKVPHKQFASTVSAVLCTRLIRKLCNTCKFAYEPSPDLLKKLGIPPGKVTSLYRVPKPEEIEKPCKDCGNIGYLGRTGLFELLIVNDKVREALIKQPKIDVLRKVARQAGMRSFQEEAILLVAKGVTSLQEAQRILQGK